MRSLALSVHSKELLGFPHTERVKNAKNRQKCQLGPVTPRGNWGAPEPAGRIDWQVLQKKSGPKTKIGRDLKNYLVELNNYYRLIGNLTGVEANFCRGRHNYLRQVGQSGSRLAVNFHPEVRNFLNSRRVRQKLGLTGVE